MAEEFQDFQKRMPSVEKRVSDIRTDDIRVSVIGTVIDQAEGRIIIDDGTGNVSVTFEGPVGIKNGKIARIMGRVIPMEGGIEIQGDVLQDMTGMDMELKRKVDKITG